MVQYVLTSFVVTPLLKFSTRNYIYIDVLENMFLMVPSMLQVNEMSHCVASA